MGIDVDSLFKTLESLCEQWISRNYLDDSNAVYRKYNDKEIKAWIFCNDYLLKNIEVDFARGGVRVTGMLSKKYVSSPLIQYSPYDAYFTIIRGSKTLQQLLYAYYVSTGHPCKVVRVENNCLIISPKVISIFEIDELLEKKPDDIVDSAIDGGINTLKQMLEDINNHITQFNCNLLDIARRICAN